MLIKTKLSTDVEAIKLRAHTADNLSNADSIPLKREPVKARPTVHTLELEARIPEYPKVLLKGCADAPESTNRKTGIPPVLAPAAKAPESAEPQHPASSPENQPVSISDENSPKKAVTITLEGRRSGSSVENEDPYPPELCKVDFDCESISSFRALQNNENSSEIGIFRRISSHGAYITTQYILDVGWVVIVFFAVLFFILSCVILLIGLFRIIKYYRFVH
ncbi:uncharacterized protein NEMAJ01_0550 [Nematocida major]|uniref:uncharacterized protein n=1 Tax=Nematocida major TaxID=1912982 RepID=UPI0020087B56|nr:uncharacterized protein NEMAJ01_0550 [Nematocida major]KAH9385654.1 hypothetical protein NEMAJ01_0550 [Nematocida major]